VKAFRPAIVVAVLLVVTAIALRGHVPGVEPAAPTRPEPPKGDDPLALAFVVGLLVASIAIVGLAVLARLRRRGGPPTSVAARPDWLRDDGPRKWRRVAVIVVVAIAGCFIGWLIAVLIASQFGGVDPTAPSVAHSPDAPASDVVDDGHAEPPQPPPPPDDNGDLLSYLLGATAVLLLVLVAGTVVATRTHRPAASGAPTGEGHDEGPTSDASTPLARAAEVGLAEVEDASREPRKAIIACYAAMERELANVPDAMPQDFDTASEVLARAVEHHALGPGSATRLVELFDEARFSPHVMGEGHRDQAVEVLQHVLDELRSRA
jgi:MFS family permease